MNWIAQHIETVVPIVVVLILGFGYLLKRRISGQAHVEDEESLERTLRLKRLLEENDMTLGAAKELREQFRRQGGNLLAAEAKAVIAKRVEAEKAVSVNDPDAGADDWQGEIRYEETTAGMATKAGAELDALESQLTYATGELAHGCSEARSAKLWDAHEAWKTYRQKEAEFAALLWEGGTGAKLLHVGRMIQLTEERIRDIALAKAENEL